jgi:hypothetical protein
VWESGFISIPFDFRLQDLQPRLQRLLKTAAYIDLEADKEQVASPISDPPSSPPADPLNSGTGNGSGGNAQERIRSAQQQWEFSSGSGREQGGGGCSWDVQGRAGVAQGGVRPEARIWWQQSGRSAGSIRLPPRCNSNMQHNPFRCCYAGCRATQQGISRQLRF